MTTKQMFYWIGLAASILTAITPLFVTLYPALEATITAVAAIVATILGILLKAGPPPAERARIAREKARKAFQDRQGKL